MSKVRGFVLVGCLAVGTVFAGGSAAHAGDAELESASIPAPISLYRFDESTGATTIADAVRGAAGQGNVYGTPVFGPGKVGNAICFDGSSQYATAPLVGDGLSEFTIAAWVKLDQTTTWGTIASNWGDVSTGAFQFGLNNTTGRWSNYIGQVSTPATPIAVASPNNASVGEWQYVVTTASQSAGSAALYEDGVEVDTTTFNDTIRNFSTLMSFGVKLNDAQDGPAPTSTGWLDGCLDEIAFWDTALTPAQIEAVIESETGVPEEGSEEPDVEEPGTEGEAGELADTGAQSRDVIALLALTGLLGAAGLAAVAHSRRGARRSN